MAKQITVTRLSPQRIEAQRALREEICQRIDQLSKKYGWSSNKEVTGLDE